MICRICGTEIDPSLAACPSCGAPVEGAIDADTVQPKKNVGKSIFRIVAVLLVISVVFGGGLFAYKKFIERLPGDVAKEYIEALYCDFDYEKADQMCLISEKLYLEAKAHSKGVQTWEYIERSHQSSKITNYDELCDHNNDLKRDSFEEEQEVYDLDGEREVRVVKVDYLSDDELDDMISSNEDYYEDYVDTDDVEAAAMVHVVLTCEGDEHETRQDFIVPVCKYRGHWHPAFYSEELYYSIIHYISFQWF